MIEKTVAWMSDRWVPIEDASISVADLGFRQAVTIVERLRTYHGRCWQTERHLDRFQATCNEIGLEFDRDRWLARTIEVLRQNAHAIDGDVGVVLLVTPGVGGIQTEIAHLTPIDHAVTRDRRVAGQPLVITDVVQPPPQSWSRQWKVRNRLHYFLADQFAIGHDADATGALIEADGSLTESGIANIAVVRDGQVWRPPATRVLAGVTQSVVFELLDQIGIPWHEGPLSPRQCVQADEVWLMGTGTGLWFANRVWAEGSWSPLDRSKPMMCRLLQSEFEKLTQCHN